MGNKGVAHKDNREIIKIARRNGARIVNGKKHLKIFDGEQLVLILSHGSKRSDKVPGGMAKVALRKFAARGWV